MYKVIEITEEHIKRFGDAFGYVYSEFEVVDGKYYILSDGTNEKMLYRYDNVFTLFEFDEENDLTCDMFVVDNDYNIIQLGTEDYEITFTKEYPVFIDREKEHQHILTQIKRPNNENDVDGYNGVLTYLEYNPEKDTRSIINYQYMYNENLKRIYDFKINEPFTVQIEKHASRLIHSKKSFISRKYDGDTIASDFMVIKDYGLQEFIQSGKYHLMRNEGQKRYYRMISRGINNYAITLFPLCAQYNLDDMNNMLESIGHNTSIPKFMIDFYNGNYTRIEDFERIIATMKEIEKEEIEPVTLRFEKGDNND